MDNKIEVFKNEQFGEIRTALIENEPWFVAVDVCRALEIGNSSQAISRLDADEKMITLISNEGNKRGNPNMTVVKEPGLYTLILSSRKSEAKAFKRWITHEVIPTIRKTGGYMTDSLLERIQKEPAVIVEFAQALILEKNRVKALERELNTAKPKADYYDAFINPDDCTNIRTTAKELKIPERKFVQFLLREKYLSLRSASSLQQGQQCRTVHRPRFCDVLLHRFSDLLHAEGQGCHPIEVPEKVRYRVASQDCKVILWQFSESLR